MGGHVFWWFVPAVDADGDLLSDAIEDRNGDGDPANDDTDVDGVPDYLDPDDDGDGVDTWCEVTAGYGTEASADADLDGWLDGVEWLNFLIADPDVDAEDALDLDGGSTGVSCEVPWDRDADGVIDALDPDDDGDGLATGTTELGTDLDCRTGTAIPTGDGVPDYLDFDSDDDAIVDGAEALGDSDGDFQVDYLDCDESGCAGDSDADGWANCDEATSCGQPECASDPDLDQDGVVDGVESVRDTDGDGAGDWVDADDDGDGHLTRDEAGMPCADPLVYEWGGDAWVFGCGAVTYDLGSNGLEVYPDTDADGVVDLRDADDDGDGVPTAGEVEGDADGDGVPAYLDPDEPEPLPVPADTGDSAAPPADTAAAGGSGDPPVKAACGCATGRAGALGWLGCAAIALRRRRTGSARMR